MSSFGKMDKNFSGSGKTTTEMMDLEVKMSSGTGVPEQCRIAGSKGYYCDGYAEYCLPTFPVSLGGETKSRWSLLSGAYAT